MINCSSVHKSQCGIKCMAAAVIKLMNCSMAKVSIRLCYHLPFVWFWRLEYHLSFDKNYEYNHASGVDARSKNVNLQALILIVVRRSKRETTSENSSRSVECLLCLLVPTIVNFHCVCFVCERRQRKKGQQQIVFSCFFAFLFPF